jgi:hypothetical protein
MSNRLRSVEISYWPEDWISLGTPPKSTKNCHAATRMSTAGAAAQKNFKKALALRKSSGMLTLPFRPMAIMAA